MADNGVTYNSSQTYQHAVAHDPDVRAQSYPLGTKFRFLFRLASLSLQDCARPSVTSITLRDSC